MFHCLKGPVRLYAEPGLCCIYSRNRLPATKVCIRGRSAVDKLIRMNIKQSDRLVQLNESARNQMEALKNNKNIKELEVLQQQVNEDNKYLIDSK